MRYIVLALCLLLTLQKHLSLDYNHSLKILQLYDTQDNPIHFQLTFDTDSISLLDSFRGQDLYLNKHRKYKIENVQQFVKYDYKLKAGLSSSQQLEISGVIGLREGSSLLVLLKHVLALDRAKLAFKHKEGLIYVVPESCNYPVFPPLTLTLSQTNTRSYTVDFFSTNFRPDSNFLIVINQQKSPFQASASSLEEGITVSVRDRIISVKLKDLLSCGRFSQSKTYECEVALSETADVGGLLLDFDPVICSKGIQLQQSQQQSWGYHMSHLVLLCLQFLVLICLVQQEKVLKVVVKLNSKTS